MTHFADVSVVVPCYRCESTVRRAVMSVAAQTLRPRELILVDDASGDGTLEVLYAVQRELGGWVQVLSLPSNAGAASARNAGWDHATQPYIAFLDADDAWHVQKIEIQFAYLQAHPEVVLCGHLCRQLPAETSGPLQWPVADGPVQVVTWAALLMRHQFVTPSVMLRRTITQRFAPGLRHMEDYRLWLDIVGQGMAVVKLQVELAAVFKAVYGASGLSANMWAMERAELANYQYFYHRGKISWMQLRLLQVYSLTKYVRRLLLVQWQNGSKTHG